MKDNPKNLEKDEIDIEYVIKSTLLQYINHKRMGERKVLYEELGNDTYLVNYGLDSLDFGEAVYEIERQTGKKADKKRLRHGPIRTFGDVIELFR